MGDNNNNNNKKKNTHKKKKKKKKTQKNTHTEHPELLFLYTRVLQKVLSLGSDYFSFIKHIFIINLQSIPPLLKHIFVTFLPSREKQINSLLLVSVGDIDK